jgi:hypothetical protein
LATVATIAPLIDRGTVAVISRLFGGSVLGPEVFDQLAVRTGIRQTNRADQHLGVGGTVVSHRTRNGRCDANDGPTGDVDNLHGRGVCPSKMWGMSAVARIV